MRKFARFVLSIFGWKVQGEYTDDIKLCVICVAPHTSNWDFIWGFLARTVYGINARYLIKDSFFKSPIGWFFRMTGGIPVDRSKKNELTETLKSMLNSGEKVQIVFTPEGTRKRVDKWRSGFYWVAYEASLPIIMHSIDYKKKLVTMREPFYPSGDWETDKKIFEEYYSDKTPGNPEGWNPKF